MKPSPERSRFALGFDPRRYLISPQYRYLLEALKAIPADGSCINWPFAKMPGGYGTTKKNGKEKLTHRVAYELTYGPIPKGLFCRHECGNPSCFRPDHLWLSVRAR